MNDETHEAYNLPDFNPGGIESPKDDRDFKLGKITAPEPHPARYIPDTTGMPTYYQGQYPACGAHSGAYFKVIQESLESGVPQSLSPRYLWSEIKKIDGFDPRDGTTMRAILKTLASRGVCDYALLPNTYDLSLNEYTNPPVSEELRKNAHPRIIQSYAFLDDLSWYGIQNAIWSHKAVLLLLYVDEGFFGTNTPTCKSKKWGHFVTAYGYDEDSIYIKDSTERNETLSWKKLGKDYLPFVREAGTAVDMKNIVVENLDMQVSLLKKLVELYKKLLTSK